MVENSPHLHINLQPQDPEVKFLEVVGAFANAILTRPQLGGLSHLERFARQITTQLKGLPYLADLADRAACLGRLPHLLCKHDQDKVRAYVDGRVSPNWSVTSPT